MKSLRVIHVIGGGTTGGAARAALGLHSALLAENLDSCVLQSHGRAVDGNSTSLDDRYISRLPRIARSALDNSLGNLARRGGDGRAFSPGVFGSLAKISLGAGEILHLHWINGGGFRLPKFGHLRGPVVWTFHDMWPFTGGCHYAYKCRGFEESCVSCPAIGSLYLARLLQLQKKRAVKSGVQGVAVSRWLAAEADRSAVFGGRRVVSIPNLVDTRVFWPVAPAVAREALGLDVNRKIILTGHSSSSYQKGADLLAEAIRVLKTRGEVFDLLSFGRADTALMADVARHYGYVGDAITLRLLFSAADVFAFPSRTEAFGRTIIEAFACGTPVVAFSGSGPDDIITDGETGALVPTGDTSAFAFGLGKCLASKSSMTRACRKRAETLYSKSVVARSYINLYKSLLHDRV